MKIVLVEAEKTTPQAWRNGGGQTRELLAWPAQGDWSLRISRADIEQHGPFSAFPQVQRWFTVLNGAGVALDFGHGAQALRRGDAPLCFDGGLAPGCELLDGATQDLNLMLRNGSGGMFACRQAQAWQQTFAMRGLYTTVAGEWQGGAGGKDSRTIPAHTLLWAEDADTGPWHFTATEGNADGHAWWLGFTPKE